MIKTISNKQRGFTVIELLVVIAVIALIAVLILSAVKNVRVKGRDARRVSDIKSIQEGLSMYYNNNYLYPDSGGGAIEIDGASDAMSAALLGDEVMLGMPIDPFNGSIDAVTYKYYYESLDSQRDYVLQYCLETDSIKPSGCYTAKP